MSDCVAAVIVGVYIYLMVKGKHTRSGLFFVGVLSILAMFIARAIIVGNARDFSTVQVAGVCVEICLGIAFFCLAYCLPRASIDQQVSDEVKHVIGNATDKARDESVK